MAGMASARLKAIREKRRRGIRPYCRKRTLTSRAIAKLRQDVSPGAEQLNPDFSTPTPFVVEQKRVCGAPKGNQNRLVHGKYSHRCVEFRARVRAHIHEARALVAATRRLMRGETQNVAPIGDIRDGSGDPK
jgi:hypothetical protein